MSNYGSPGIMGFGAPGFSVGGHHGVYGAGYEVIDTGYGGIVRSGNQVGIIPGPALFGTPMGRSSYEPTGYGFDRTLPAWKSFSPSPSPSSSSTTPCKYTEENKKVMCIACKKIQTVYVYNDWIETRHKCLTCYECWDVKH